MTSETFNDIVTERCTAIRTTLTTKQEEYATQDDVLHNFQRAAWVGETTPEKALIGMFLKHYVSILDMVDKAEEGQVHSKEKIDEKIGDAINYLILLEALFKEHLYDS